MNKKHSMTWLSDLENSLNKIDDFKNTLQYKLKALMVKLEGSFDQAPLTDYDQENLFSELDKTDLDNVSDYEKSLETARLVLKDIGNSIKEDFEIKKKECDKILSSAHDEMQDIKDLDNFLNVWLNKMKNSQTLERYPEELCSVLERVRPGKEKLELLESMSQVLPLPEKHLEEMHTSSHRSEHQIDVGKTTSRSHRRFSVLDYTTIGDEMPSMTGRRSSSVYSYSEENVLNVAVCEDDEDGHLDNDRQFDDYDDYPSIDTCRRRERIDSDSVEDCHSYYHASIDDRSIAETEDTILEGDSSIWDPEKCPQYEDHNDDDGCHDGDGGEPLGAMSFSVLNFTVQENSICMNKD